MPRKSSKTQATTEPQKMAPIALQPITETIEKNYMPYTMSVIVSRAIPEIDGLKPSHRKLLYTMFKMGLLTGRLTKSTNVVGETMKLNPHGDAAIYDTLVRLTRGNETLLHPLIESKGSFGKKYSSDTVSAASRYTEVKLDEFCNELFRGIDKNAVDMVDNYDGSMKEPVLLPTSFPNILVTPNSGIAVGMASDICSFNLAEICDGTIALLKKPALPVDQLMDIIKAPDFSGGGILLYDRDSMREIFETGQGSVRLRARYNYDRESNCIDVVQIPYSTTIELIMKKLTELIKAGKLKEITDFRDEIDLSGFKLTLDLKKGTDPDKLMVKLFHTTPLESNFKCNFNVLIDSVPKRLGVRDILLEWIRFRMGCLRRELTYDLEKKRDKLHLLLGLGKILLDIDKAIRIIRKTEEDEMVIPNLMVGFSIDEIQANYIADIKLRNLNRRYILDRVSEIEELQKEIADIEETLKDDLKVKSLIIKQLTQVKQKYGQPRKTMIIHNDTIEEYVEEDPEDGMRYRILLSQEGYFKKLPLRPSTPGREEQKLKDGDQIIAEAEGGNNDELIFFTNKSQMYRCRIADFDLTRANLIGDYIPAKLGMDDGERPMMMNIQNSYPAKDHVIFLFANGKGVRIPASTYETKAFRKRLTGAYSDASPAVAILYEKAGHALELLLVCSDQRGILIKSTLIPAKTTRTAAGVQIVTLRPGATLERVMVLAAGDSRLDQLKSCRKAKIPSATVDIRHLNLSVAAPDEASSEP